jgi:hypothetical protein
MNCPLSVNEVGGELLGVLIKPEIHLTINSLFLRGIDRSHALEEKCPK